MSATVDKRDDRNRFGAHLVNELDYLLDRTAGCDHILGYKHPSVWRYRKRASQAHLTIDSLGKNQVFIHGGGQSKAEQNTTHGRRSHEIDLKFFGQAGSGLGRQSVRKSRALQHTRALDVRIAVTSTRKPKMALKDCSCTLEDGTYALVIPTLNILLLAIKMLDVLALVALTRCGQTICLVHHMIVDLLHLCIS
jgi:hypothetical protein